MRFTTKLARLIKIFWVNVLWHKTFCYGYCPCWNWQSCKLSGWTDCPCIKYNVHCGHIFSTQELENPSELVVWNKGAKEDNEDGNIKETKQ